MAGKATGERDVWKPFRFFVGSWTGRESGRPGIGRGDRTYEFILGGKFLQVKNRSVYEPQEKNPKGEVHEELGLVSYDQASKRFMLREFHVEGFVNQYALDGVSGDGKTFVFLTESIENIPPGWRARLTYKILNADRFHEVFELAEPGKDFEVYVESGWTRAR